MRYKTLIQSMAVWIVLITMVLPCHGTQSIVAQKVDVPPVIDGKAGDAAWRLAKPVVTRENMANIDVVLQAVYAKDRIFIKVEFKDPNASRIHKPLVWNPSRKMYAVGPDREDTFILKWAIDGDPNTDLSVYSPKPHIADIWFWKANRTDPVGYADDKLQILSTVRTRKSKEISSAGGHRLYLKRLGDRGEPAYMASIQKNYNGDRLQQYTHRRPTGSRSDISAKGEWGDNKWCIEFSRNLTTNHADDVQFDRSKTYLFGVSRYEIAGRQKNPELTQPFYGAGDVGEKLILEFSQ